MIRPMLLLQLLLLQQHFTDIRACHAAIGRVFTRQAGAVAASAARQGAENALRRAASEVLSNAGSQVAKKTIGQSIKNGVKKVGEKGVEIAGQGLIFGVVDQAGDALRGSLSSDSNLADQVDKVVGKQLLLTEIQNNRSVKQMDHDQKMAQFDIQKLQLMKSHQPTVIIEEIEDDQNMNANFSHPKAVAARPLKEHSHKSTSENTRVPKWLAPAAYFAGSFGAFLSFFVVYKCIFYACEASNNEGRR